MTYIDEDGKDGDKAHDLDELEYEKSSDIPSPRHATFMRAVTIKEDESAPARELRLRRQVSQVDTASRVVGEFR